MGVFIQSRKSDLTYTPLTVTKDIHPEYWLTEQLIHMDEVSHNIMQELMLANYIYEMDEIPEVLTEGFGDFIESAVEFFKNLIKKVVEFFKQVFTYMSSYFIEFDKFIEKNKNRLSKAGKIKVQGYRYTLDKDVPKLDHINKIVSEFNNEIAIIEHVKLEDLRKRIEDFRNENKMDLIRASIINSFSPIEAEDFEDEVFKLFRNGESDKQTIEYTGSDIYNIINEYKTLKSEFKKFRRDQINIEKLLGSLKSFFEKGYKSKYVGTEKKHVASTVTKDISGKKYIASTDVIIDDDLKIVQVLNLYYSFRFTQAREISNMIMKVAIMKTNAYKEAIRFYEHVLRKAVFGGDTSDTN